MSNSRYTQLTQTHKVRLLRTRLITSDSLGIFIIFMASISSGILLTSQ